MGEEHKNDDNLRRHFKMTDKELEGATDEQRVKLELFNKLLDKAVDAAERDKKEQIYKNRLMSKQKETNLRESADQLKAEREMLEMFEAGNQYKKSKWYQFDFNSSKALNTILIFVVFVPLAFIALSVLDVLSIFFTWVEGFFSGGTARADNWVDMKIETMFAAGFSVLLINKLLYSICISTFFAIVNWFSD